jgi:hypothetical protein
MRDRYFGDKLAGRDHFSIDHVETVITSILPVGALFTVSSRFLAIHSRAHPRQPAVPTCQRRCASAE